LESAEREQFLARYLAEITEAYPRTADGKALLRFPRLFIVAAK
jgi:trans-aconitate 2-methyltransferase